MVRFLLENSLGAWWAARHPDSPLLNGFEYLRFDEDGEPAAGRFDGWPDRVAEVTVMDPCCGSGHFLVEAFSDAVADARRGRRSAPGRRARRGAARQPVRAGARSALRPDRHVQRRPTGLEDRRRVAPASPPQTSPARVSPSKPRSTSGRRSHTATPASKPPSPACTPSSKTPTHSAALIDPRQAIETSTPSGQTALDDANWTEIAPLLQEAATHEDTDPAATVLGTDAAALSRAADYLSHNYTLLATNVPYLGRTGQGVVLRTYLTAHNPVAAEDLAIAFTQRLTLLTRSGGSVAQVLPEATLFLSSLEEFRRTLLKQGAIGILALLGPRAFEEIGGEVVRVCLMTITPCNARNDHVVGMLDVGSIPRAGKPEALARACELEFVPQRFFLEDRLCRLVPGINPEALLLRAYATSTEGMSTGDGARYQRAFWEIAAIDDDWYLFQRAPDATMAYGGIDHELCFGSKAKAT